MNLNFESFNKGTNFFLLLRIHSCKFFIQHKKVNVFDGRVDA